MYSPVTPSARNLATRAQYVSATTSTCRYLRATTARPRRGIPAGPRSARAIIEGALTELGASLEDVVRTVVYITDTDHGEGITRAHGEIFGGIMPASTLVVVTALLKPNLVVEIEAYAVRDR